MSFAGPLRDLAYTICFYSNESSFDCNKNRFDFVLTSYIVVLIPLFYRSIQCTKLAYLSGSFFTNTQFFNLLKYLASVTAVSVAFAFKFHKELLPAYIVVSIISMLYSFYWDLKHDWGFL